MQALRLDGRGIAALTLFLGVLGGCASTGIGRGDWQNRIPSGCDVERVDFAPKGGARLLLLSVKCLDPDAGAQWASGVREALLGSIAEKRQSRIWRKTLPKAMQIARLDCTAASHDQAFWVGQASGADAVLWGQLHERPRADGTNAVHEPNSVEFHLTPVHPAARQAPFDKVVDFPRVPWWASWKEGTGGQPASVSKNGGDIQPRPSGEDAEPTRPVLAMNDNGIGPGPFNPGRQPVPCYIGNEVHRVIGAFYQSMHLEESVFLTRLPSPRS